MDGEENGWREKDVWTRDGWLDEWWREVSGWMARWRGE